jgi:hypothetical protein
MDSKQNEEVLLQYMNSLQQGVVLKRKASRQISLILLTVFLIPISSMFVGRPALIPVLTILAVAVSGGPVSRAQECVDGQCEDLGALSSGGGVCSLFLAPVRDLHWCRRSRGVSCGRS